MEPAVPGHSYNICNLPVVVSVSGTDLVKLCCSINVLAWQILQLLPLKSLLRELGPWAICRRWGESKICDLYYPSAFPTLTPTQCFLAHESD